MDGLSYCITYDMVETGIFYNKKIFRQLGIVQPSGIEPRRARVDLEMGTFIGIVSREIVHGRH